MIGGKSACSRKKKERNGSASVSEGPSCPPEGGKKPAGREAGGEKACACTRVLQERKEGGFIF